MKISKRLQEISKFVDNNSNIIDVGCDHALLDIYLFNNKENVKIIASDIKEGPLNQAKKNIAKYGCDIKTKLGFGISTIEEEIDTIIITGMGGDTIIDILQEGKDKLTNVKRIIISPQSEWKKVRKHLVTLGFYIKNEKIIKDNKYYLILKFEKGIKKYTNRELEFGPILLKHKSSDFLNYYNGLLQDTLKVLKKIPIYKIKDQIITRKRVCLLRKILKNE